MLVPEQRPNEDWADTHDRKFGVHDQPGQPPASIIEGMHLGDQEHRHQRVRSPWGSRRQKTVTATNEPRFCELGVARPVGLDLEIPGTDFRSGNHLIGVS